MTITVQHNKSSNRLSRLSARQINLLYSSPLPATRSGSLYNAFSYPTKISPESIAIFIATHTKPGDVVLDTFSGSGTTGLATLLCDKPTDELKKIASEHGVKPMWGPRRAVLYEVGVLGSFISKTMCNPPNPGDFEKAALELISAAEKKVGDIYQAKDPAGNIGRIRHAIWSDVLECPHCKTENLFFDVAVRRKPLHFLDIFVCRKCKKKTSINQAKRSTESIYDSLLDQKLIQKKRRLAFIYGQTAGKNWERHANSADIALLKNINALPLPSCVPVVEMEWGELYRSGYHQGITHIHHFYTRRNLLAFATLWELIDQFAPNVQDALRLLTLSYNATHSTLMTRVVAKIGQKDFVLTGAQSGVLYISGLPVEKNILAGLRRKLPVIRDAFSIIHGSKSVVQVVRTSSAKLHLADRSVDYVFTDPPFGDYIPYAELNQLNEVWLGQMTPRSDEIIISPSQNKNVGSYAALMEFVFREIARVLKDEAKATVVFHSAKAAVWRALMESYSNAGFIVETSSVLDKIQGSFKQVVSDISVKGDPLLLLSKGTIAKTAKGIKRKKSEQIATEILSLAIDIDKSSKERTVERLYSRYVSRCLELGVGVTINAQEFYSRARLLEGCR